MSKKIDELRGVVKEERKERERFPETYLLKRCTTIKASSDGKKVELLDNSGENLAKLYIEDNEHQNLVLAEGKKIVGRYQFSKDAGEYVWSIYDTNSMDSKQRIIDDERLKPLKQLFQDMKNTATQAVKYGKEFTRYRIKTTSGRSKP